MADSAACRILVLSSSLDRAQQFVQRVKTLSSEISGSENPSSETNTSDVASTTVPWTIVNKYYTADVHFELRELGAFSGHHASEVPAIVYVWNRGEAYKDHVPTIANQLQAHDPEVSLAVCFSGPSAAPQDEEALDEFLSSHGFEYINGDRTARSSTHRHSDDDDSDIPGLPRVIDALSTIQWPSLIQSAATSARRSRAHTALGAARDAEAHDGLAALLPGGTSRMEREMAALQRWLDEAHAGDDDEAWTARVEGGAPRIRVAGEVGFEDDFAEFVGAPVEVEGLERMHTGASWHTLASDVAPHEEDVAPHEEDVAPHEEDVAPHEEDVAPHEEDVAPHEEEDEDEDLPTRAEIEETTRRIFGDAVLGVPAVHGAAHTANNKAQAANDATPAANDAPPAANNAPLAADPWADFGPDAEDNFDAFFPDPDSEDDEYEMRPFDLSRVFGALESMKAEIAGITDEQERRKAAARVALGLVYGLERERESVEAF